MLESDIPFPELPPPPDLYHKQGWAEFCRAARPEPPPMPTPAERRRWTEADREAFDIARLTHLGRMGAFKTETMQSIHDGARRQVRSNIRTCPGARRGTIIDGLGNLGKTTILHELGRDVQRRMLGQFGPAGFQRKEGEAEFLPVVNVLMPANATIKTFGACILEFCAHPVVDSWTEKKIKKQVVSLLREDRVALVLVDELQFLNQRRVDHRDVSNYLKGLADELPVTFVYACIGAEECGLLDEGSGGTDIYSQTRRRFTVRTVTAFSYELGKAGDEWLRLLAAFHPHLGLMRMNPERFLGLAEYLHARTQGVIGALSQLLREGAETAIVTGKETLTIRMLDEITLDHESEQAWTRRRGRHIGQP
jgi:hypothetical protein